MARRVRERDRLARLCRQVEKWEGGLVNAAHCLGVAVGHFSRLRNGKAGDTVRDKTAHRLTEYRPSRHVAPRELAHWRESLKAAIAYAPWTRAERHQWVAGLSAAQQGDATLVEGLRRTYPAAFRPLDRLQAVTPPERLAVAALQIAEELRDILPRKRLAFRSEHDSATFRLLALREKSPDLSLSLSVRTALRAYLDAAVEAQCKLLALEQERAAARRVDIAYIEQQLRERKEFVSPPPGVPRAKLGPRMTPEERRRFERHAWKEIKPGHDRPS